MNVPKFVAESCQRGPEVAMVRENIARFEDLLNMFRCLDSNDQLVAVFPLQVYFESESECLV